MEVLRFAKLFDHSIVRPDASLRGGGSDARRRRHGWAPPPSPCSHTMSSSPPVRCATADVLVGTVVGFPHGNETPSMKAYQAREVLDLGAEEIDMVMNIPALKNGEKELFVRDVAGVVGAAAGLRVKVILENCYLTREEKQRACEWIVEGGAHFVKTSTAYADGGATLEDVRLMYQVVKGRCFVKAAGGIREPRDVLAYLQAGARRFGSTRTEQFVRRVSGVVTGRTRALCGGSHSHL